MIGRFLPLVGVVLFFAIGFIWRAWLQYRRHGDAGIILFHSRRPAQIVRDALFMACLLFMTVQAIVTAAAPEVLERIQVVSFAQPDIAVALGALLVAGGTFIMVRAQLHLGASWRIGIDDRARPGLVTGGLYAYSRNPIFLGMFVILAGLTVLSPTWISIAVLVGSICCVHSQVLEEEAYLLKTYGDAYLRYASDVGRFVPMQGRLSRSASL